MDGFAIQGLSCLIVVTTAALLGYGGNVCRRPLLAQSCRFAVGGVLLGFAIGASFDLYSGEFRDWILRARFVPFRIQEFFATHQIDTVYAFAPTFGMISGLGVAVLFVYLRPEKYDHAPVDSRWR